MCDILGSAYPTEKRKMYEFLTSESEILDTFLGGGLLKGAITELHGREETGKSAIAALYLKQSLKNGLHCLYVDTGDNLNPKDFQYPNLYYCKVIDDTLLKELATSPFDLIIIDDITSFFGNDQFCNEKNQFLDFVCHAISKTNGSVLLINQVRNIQVNENWYQVALGGKGTIQRSSVRLYAKKIKKETDGVRISLEIQKSPFVSQKSDILFLSNSL